MAQAVRKRPASSHLNTAFHREFNPPKPAASHLIAANWHIVSDKESGLDPDKCKGRSTHFWGAPLLLTRTANTTSTQKCQRGRPSIQVIACK